MGMHTSLMVRAVFARQGEKERKKGRKHVKRIEKKRFCHDWLTCWELLYIPTLLLLGPGNI